MCSLNLVINKCVSKLYVCVKTAGVCLLCVASSESLHPNRLDSGRGRSGLFGSSSPLPTSPASLKEALWMIWARWRPRCSRAFSRVRDDFLCIPPLVLPEETDSPAASAGGFRSLSGFRFPGRTLGNRQPRPPPLLLFVFSLSDSAPGDVTTPSSCRWAARGGGRYWMARRPL